MQKFYISISLDISSIDIVAFYSFLDVGFPPVLVTILVVNSVVHLTSLTLWPLEGQDEV